MCVGSGPSLTDADLDFCRRRGWSLAVCNSTYRRVPDAKVFHAMDDDWWRLHSKTLFDTMDADCLIYSGSTEASRTNERINLVAFNAEQGFSTKTGLVKSGKLTGLQLIQIVGWQQPDLILLLGYDNQITDGKTHEHDLYNNANPPPSLVGALSDFESLAKQSPYPIINCSRQSAIQAFPRMTVEDAYYSMINEREKLIYNVKRWLSLGWYR